MAESEGLESRISGHIAALGGVTRWLRMLEWLIVGTFVAGCVFSVAGIVLQRLGAGSGIDVGGFILALFILALSSTVRRLVAITSDLAEAVKGLV
ncbi:MAG: hypothetical protein ACRELB_08320 [Polyangiaceae bacterium]